MVEGRALALYHFISKHRNLCNAHSVDFFVHDHWGNVVDKDWQDLDGLPSDDAVLKPLALNNAGIPQSLHEFFLEAKSLRLNGLWSGDTRSPEHKTSEYSSDACNQEIKTAGTIHQIEDQWCCGTVILEDQSKISKPVDEVLPSMQELKSGKKVSEMVKREGTFREAVSRFGMNMKKAHEVKLFSEFVAKEVALDGVVQVLDVGSGKGYLSQHLALCYDFTVVGVDAQLGNTTGASKRNKKVHKMWKKSAAKEVVQPDMSDSPVSQVSLDFRCALEDDMSLELLFTTSQTDEGHTATSNDSIIKEEKSLDISSHDVVTDETSTMCQSACSHSVVSERGDHLTGKVWKFQLQCPGSESANDHVGTEERRNESKGKPAQRTVEDRQKKGSNEVNESSFLAAVGANDSSSFCPLTMELTAANIPSLLRAAEEESKGVFCFKQPFAVVGLHTCGDLASTVLRLFAAVPTARSVCLVGCCYHHITESSGEEGGDSRVPDVAGFPMSRRLKEMGAHLGRKTRMLACQTVTKFRETTTGDSLQAIFWRAVLQVVFARKFRKVYERSSSNLVTGRLKKGIPEDFIAYARLLIPKVGLSNSEVSDKQLLEIEEEFLPRKKQLEYYLKFRAVLAPCIESILILDRLLFLQEMDVIESAEIKGVFDPVVSPRCMALVAHKHN